MRNHNKLRHPTHLPQHLIEPAPVGIIERGIDLIEDAERRRAHLEQREDERERGHRFFATGEQGDPLNFFTWRLHFDLNADLQNLPLLLDEPRDPACDEATVQVTEAAVDIVERL